MTRKMFLGTTLMLGMAAVAVMPACAAEATTRKAETKAEAKEEAEVKMKLSDCPAAVQATLTREAAGAAIKDVDKEADNGKTIYETDVVIGGKTYEVKVAEDGTLISKKVEDEKEEGEKKEEQGEHEEKK